MTGEWRELCKEELHNLTCDYRNEGNVSGMGGAFSAQRDE
jgi:hypothetical protein